MSKRKRQREAAMQAKHYNFSYEGDGILKAMQEVERERLNTQPAIGSQNNKIDFYDRLVKCK